MLYGIDLHHNLSHQSLAEPPFRGSNTASPIPASLAQLAHNEALRQHQQALLSQSQHQQQQQRNSKDATALLGVPNVRKVSSGTLGSPFNEQGQAQGGVQGTTTATAGSGGNAATVAASQYNVPIVRQPVPKKHTTTKTSNKAIGKGLPDSKAKQAFPSAQDTSMNSSNTTLNNNGTRNVKNELSSSTTRNKKPPSSNARYISGAAAGTVGRGRKASDASERSIRKDDLLDRLADALKYVFSFFAYFWLLDVRTKLKLNHVLVIRPG